MSKKPKQTKNELTNKKSKKSTKVKPEPVQIPINPSERIRNMIASRKKEKEHNVLAINKFPHKEKVLLSTGISPMLFLFPLCLWMLTIFGLVIFNFTYDIFTVDIFEEGIIDFSQKLCLSIFGITTATLLPISINKVIHFHKCRIVLTNAALKIVDKTGEKITIPMYDLEGFYIEKELFGDIFNYGTIVIQNEKLLRVELRSIAKPYILKKLVTKYLIKYKDLIDTMHNKTGGWDL